MENFNIKIQDNKIHVEGFPDAAKIIQLSDSKSYRAADLALHLTDLEFAQRCLEKIEETNDTLIHNALFLSTVVAFYKCFGDSKSRSRLSPKKIYKDDGREWFFFYRNCRDKHLVHDDNAFNQAIPGAVVNKKNASFKIAKIVCTSTQTPLLTPENLHNLSLLIKEAQIWIHNEFNRLCAEITIELETRPHDDLLAMPDKKFHPPSFNQVAVTRQRQET